MVVEHHLDGFSLVLRTRPLVVVWIGLCFRQTYRQSGAINGAMDLSIESADVLRLIQAHLTECGLHQSCRAIQQESGVLGAGVLHSNWKTWATNGDWGAVLDSLSTIETSRLPATLLADVYEMAILELGENNEMELAYATHRMATDLLDHQQKNEGNASKKKKRRNDLGIPRSRVVEQRLAALAALRGRRSTNKQQPLPPNYYGESTKTRLRENIGKRLSETVSLIPQSRLVSLLQQSVKWQSHTGQLPTIKQYWQQDDTEDDKQPTEKEAKRRKKRQFDLVLGETTLSTHQHTQGQHKDSYAESIPSKIYSTISFGKKATAEAALFLGDASGLVTGSSDGLVEIWDPKERFKDLRMDLAYQKNEELLFHDSPVSSLDVSNDGEMLATGDKTGTVKVWRLQTGKCLRQIVAHAGSMVSAVRFSPDASRVLTASRDTTCREFGLRTSRMLKEFRGHSSYVNTCHYYQRGGGGAAADDNEAVVVWVVTGSADGTARVWDGKSADLIRVFRPVSLGPTDLWSGTGASIVQTGDAPSDSGSPNMHSVIPIHTPARSVVLVPRGRRAFLVSMQGIVIQTYESEGADDSIVFVAATVSPSNRWLYIASSNGTLTVFDVFTGKVEKSIRAFAGDNNNNSSPPEITELIHHPHRGILGAYSTDKGQKRGSLTLWK